MTSTATYATATAAPATAAPATATATPINTVSLLKHDVDYEVGGTKYITPKGFEAEISEENGDNRLYRITVDNKTFLCKKKKKLTKLNCEGLLANLPKGTVVLTNRMLGDVLARRFPDLTFIGPDSPGIGKPATGVLVFRPESTGKISRKSLDASVTSRVGTQFDLAVYDQSTGEVIHTFPKNGKPAFAFPNDKPQETTFEIAPGLSFPAKILKGNDYVDNVPSGSDPIIVPPTTVVDLQRSYEDNPDADQPPILSGDGADGGYRFPKGHARAGQLGGSYWLNLHNADKWSHLLVPVDSVATTETSASANL